MVFYATSALFQVLLIIVKNVQADFVTVMEDYLQQDQLSLRNAGTELRLRLVILIQSFIFDVIVDDQNLSSSPDKMLKM